MKIIGLTGSIATGKSTVALMCRQLGLWVHDADAAVHGLLGSYGLAVAPVLAAFGDVGSRKAGIDRTKLGQIVFADHGKRQQLEAIIHPLVYQNREKFLAHAIRHQQSAIVLDVPLLFETRGDIECDYVISVWAPYFLQKQRALSRPFMTDEKFQAIISAQMPQFEKQKKSDLWLSTGLGKADTCRKLKRWISHHHLLKSAS